MKLEELEGDYAMRNYKFVYISLQQTFHVRFRLYFQLSAKLILYFLEKY